MAQGYLESPLENECSEEDLGAQYVNVLLMRSFFHDAEKDNYGNVKSFKIHDIFHVLAQSVAGGEYYAYSNPKKVPGSPVHVSSESKEVCFQDLLHIKCLRSFVKPAGCSLKNDLQCIAKFTSLRALWMYIRKQEQVSQSHVQLPNSLKNLQHMRYLSLSHNFSITSLLDSICSLINLQTLRLDGCPLLYKLPPQFSKLINLRYLSTKDCPLEFMPARFGKLTSLLGLTKFVVASSPKECGKLSELKVLNNLRGKLRIVRLGQATDMDSETHEPILEKKEFLQSLTLDWHDGTEFDPHYSTQLPPMPESSGGTDDGDLQLLEKLKPHPDLLGLKMYRYMGFRFPSWISSLENLGRLTLKGFVRCRHISALNQLPSLEYLKLEKMRAEYILYEGSGSSAVTFFPSLKQLEIVDCESLKGWNANRQMFLLSFPCLSALTVKQCPNLTCLPQFPSVESLHLEGSSLTPFAEGMRGLKKLQRLCISSCAQLENIPEWIAELTSLQEIRIANCSNLKSPPEGMPLPPNLQSFNINSCELLKQRSRKEDEEEEDD